MRTLASVDVLLLGVFHMANPGADMANAEVDDVLAPRRQSEIAAVVDALVGFRPSKVLVEHPVDDGAIVAAYEAYRVGERDLARSEAEQLGFRVAASLGHDRIYPIDVMGDFYEPSIEELTIAEPHATLWRRVETASEAAVLRLQATLADGTVADALRLLNHPAEKRASLVPYLGALLPISQGAATPGPDMAANWYRRNFRIAANVHAVAEDHDRLLVIYGAGHIPVLEHVLGTTERFRLSDPLEYLASA